METSASLLAPAPPATRPRPPGLDHEERHLVERLRRGEEAAFVALVERYQAGLLRLARDFVSTRESAEEVVQETWLGVLRGIDRFEGRSSLRTWIYRILVNRARTRGQRESRTTPFSSAFAGAADEGPAVEPERFLGPDHHWAGHWAVPPQRWAESPERRLLAVEGRALIDAAIAALPPNQRQVILLHDVQGFEGREICELMGLSAVNQRVLLHRARSKVRAALERYLDDEACAA